MMESSDGKGEIDVPVPWGQIRVQVLGDRRESGNHEYTWVAVHGWLDNSGSFETLVPFFDKEKHLFYCIDLPGHGFSSHFPEGRSYTFLDSMTAIHRVVTHLKLEKINLLGHSMGGICSMLYAATFPEFVERLVMLDVVKPMNRPVKDVVQNTRTAVSDILKSEFLSATKAVKEYDFNGARQRLMEASKSLMKNDNLTEEACDILLKRGLRPVEGGKFVFTRDFKLYNKSLYSFADDVTAEFARQVKCPHLIILASKSLDYFASEKDFIDLYRSSNPGFRLDQVEGGHHFHLTNPEVAAPLIHNFLGQSSSV